MDGMVCNKCGRELKLENGIYREDFIHIYKPWGYFSKKDGKTQEFALCELCVESLSQEFKVPLKEYDTTELI